MIAWHETFTSSLGYEQIRCVGRSLRVERFVREFGRACAERQYDLVELAKRLGWDEKPVRKALGPDKRITPTSRVGAWRSSCPPFAT